MIKFNASNLKIMLHYLTGQDRHQVSLFSKIDDLIEDRHYVRLIDILIDYFIKEDKELLAQKGNHTIGRKAYHPGLLLKIYLYGYLNSITSSRKLERECHRNIELIWLSSYLAPDHKTISDFGKLNGELIKRILLMFNRLLKESGYIKGKTVSIDGTKIKANAGLTIDLDSVKHKLENVEEQLKEYLHKLESDDQVDNEIEAAKLEKEQIQQQVEFLRKELEDLKEQKQLLEEASLDKISPTDPEARIMKSRHGKFFGYNVQAAVDDENHMIICVAVTNSQNDRGQLLPIINKVEEVIKQTPEEVLADAGYYVVNQLQYIENEKEINCYVPVSKNQEQTKDEKLGIEFTFKQEENVYVCSQGQVLAPKYGLKRDTRRGTEAQAYKGINCKPCQLFNQCTTTKEGRSIYRYTNQEWRDRYNKKMKSKEGRDKLKQRRNLSEHPFGTIKCWLGYIPLLTRGIHKVQTEINLAIMAYNIKRWINIAGFDNIKEAIIAKRMRLDYVA